MLKKHQAEDIKAMAAGPDAQAIHALVDAMTEKEAPEAPAKKSK